MLNSPSVRHMESARTLSWSTLCQCQYTVIHVGKLYFAFLIVVPSYVDSHVPSLHVFPVFGVNCQRTPTRIPSTHRSTYASSLRSNLSHRPAGSNDYLKCCQPGHRKRDCHLQVLFSAPQASPQPSSHSSSTVPPSTNCGKVRGRPRGLLRQ